MREVEVLKRVAEKTALTPLEVKAVVRAYFDEIIECNAHGDSLVIRGFGTFSSRDYKPRRYRNPSGSEHTLGPRRLPRFKPAPRFRARCQLVSKNLNHL